MAQEKLGRNDPCHCGSGKKYKNCCQRLDASPSAPAAGAVSVAQAMQLALQHHQAGQLEQAEAIYRQVQTVAPNHADALHYLGLLSFQRGDAAAAIDLISKALSFNAGDAYAHCNLGNALLEIGRCEDAIASFDRALQLNPDFIEALYNRGRALLDLERYDETLQANEKALALKTDFQPAIINRGEALLKLERYEEALICNQRALQLMPADAVAHNNFGRVLQKLHRFEEAIASYRNAIQIRPNHARAHNNLGTALQQMAQMDEAIACYRKALQLQPNDAEANYNLGNAYQCLGRYDEAIGCYQAAISAQPNYALAYNNLASVYQVKGQLSNAIDSYQRAVGLRPNYVEALSNLGLAMHSAGKTDDALLLSRRALEIDPAYAEGHNNLGRILQEQGVYEEAMQCYGKALALKPHLAEAHNNLGFAYQCQGRLGEAMASYRRALAIRPNWADVHASLIFTLDMCVDVDTATSQRERRSWADMHAAPLAAEQRPHENVADPDRRLRVGYVSADFREHSAARVFGAMLVNFDRAQFEVFAYSNSNIEDAYTRLFQRSVTAWRNIVDQSDAAVAELIRRDAIDILVDLSGHTLGSRLLVFARKPAPLQVTAWGHAAGTGLTAIDAFFCDPVMVPPEEKQLFAEEVRYLPSALGYFDIQTFPEVGVLPASHQQEVTFGSFNRLIKVSDAAISVWARVLSAFPASRLILKAGELDERDTRERILAAFAAAGIDSERLAMFGKTTWVEHMAAFNRIDIALDPFPHGGGVTTMEGLMMGVPAVTLRWPTIAGRASASILTAVGLQDWIAESEQEYIDIALKQAGEVASLAALRKRLRSLLLSSTMGHPSSYAKAVAHEYRALWRRWCSRRSEG